MASPEYVHILKESKGTGDSRTLMIVTGCGQRGRGRGMEGTGIKSTVWPSLVTCPICKLLPGVRGPAPAGTI